MRGRKTIVALEKQELLGYIFWVCVCNLSYPSRKAHAPCYIVIFVLSGCTIFFHIISLTTRVRKNIILYKMCVLIFSTSLWSISHSKKNALGIHVKYPLFLSDFNPLNPELNPICYLLALLGAHHFLHVSRIRVKLLTFRLLMSYIYGAPILNVSRSHTTTQHSR